jgi:hypothetical protein
MKEKKIIIILIFLSVVAFNSYSQDISNVGLKEKEVLIYPNPLIGDKFIIKTESNITRVEIVNMIGKVVNRAENEDTNLHELTVYLGKCEKGMYFVKITFEDNKSIIKKLLVK